jgi:TM2 domain-containing membrane protein YozV
MSEIPSGLDAAAPQIGTMSAGARAGMLYENNRRSKLVAYLLWLFMGWFGIHNFYLHRTGIAVTQLILSLIVIGLAITIPWWLVDAFFIPGGVRRQNDLLAEYLGTPN